MTISAKFIDRIVQNVMREMQTRVSPVGPAQKVSSPSTTATAVQPATLGVSGLVISEDVLARAHAAGRTISLQSGAIITPSGRDYIRRHGIRLSTQVTGVKAVTSVGTFIAIGSSTNLNTAASAAGWITLSASTEAEAASLAFERISNGVVTCCGGEPSVVACLLNRDSSVRAAVVTRGTDMSSLTSVMNPQVICLDSRGWSFGELLRLLKGQTVSHTMPTGWTELSAGDMR